jgi:hypothetical protein
MDSIQEKDLNLYKLIKNGDNVDFKTLDSLPEDQEMINLEKLACAQVEAIEDQKAVHDLMLEEFRQCRDLAQEKIHLSDRIRDTVP